MYFQKTLGEILDRLTNKDQTLPIIIDIGMCPVGIDSYRGYYDHLAISYENRGPCTRPCVGDFVSILNNANGKIFEGWNGGSFGMDRLTPLWVANPGENTRLAVTGIKEFEGVIIITTDTIEPRRNI